MGIVHHPNVVTDGLVACWDAANRRSYPGVGTVWTDLAGDADGSLVNSPVFDPENLGSIAFDGTNDYVLCGTVPGASYVSCVIMFRTTDTSVYSALIAFRDAAGADSGNLVWKFELNAGNLRVWSGGTYTDTSATYNDGEWHQAIITESDKGTGWSDYRCYVDGELVHAVDGFPGATAVSLDQPAMLMASWSGGASSASLQADIACVYIYDRVLSAEEVLQNYNAMKRRYIGTESDSLVSFWDAGDKRSYPKVYGVLGGRWGNIGYRGSDVWEGDIFLLNGFVSGSTFAADGRSISFDGTDDYGTWVSETAFDFDDKKFSFICWLKPATGNVLYDGVLGRVSASLSWNGGYGLYYEPSGGDQQLHFWAGAYATNKAVTVVTENEWNHVAGTVSPTEVLLYVNGVPNETVVAAGTLAIGVSNGWVGGIAASYISESDIASLAYYDRTLSAAEVVKHYNQTKGNFA